MEDREYFKEQKGKGNIPTEYIYTSAQEKFVPVQKNES